MALLQGNNLREWIAALEPIEPAAFKTMPGGMRIIHLDSQTMEPVYYAGLESGAIGTDPLVLTHANDTTLLDPKSTSGWFYYPEPAVEVTPIAAKQKGMVKELGGNWNNTGAKPLSDLGKLKGDQSW